MAMISSLIGGAAGLLSQLTSSLSSSASTATSQASSVAGSYTHKPSRHEKLMTEALQAQGFDDETIAEIHAQVNDAVSQLKAQGSVTRQSVKYTVDGILKQNGVDLTKFEAYMQAHRPQRSPSSTTGTATAENSDELDTYA